MSKMRATFSQRGDDIHGTISIDGDGVFAMECVALIISELATKYQVPVAEVIQDLHSIAAGKVT
jgi:hypothetical protein